MNEKILVPVLGESITEATVAKWLKNVGDTVEADEAVVELETDKVNLEVPSPINGTIGDIKFKDGDVVKVGTVLGSIQSNGKNNQTEIKKIEPDIKINDSLNLEKEEKEEDSLVLAADEEPLALVADEEPLVLTEEVGDKKDIKKPIKSSTLPPSVRKIVAEKSIDVKSIKGTGKDGRISKGDLLNLMSATPKPNERKIKFGEEERIKMSRLRQTIAKRLKQAQQNAAILTTFNEVDMTSINDMRKENQEDFKKRYGTKLGFMSFFVKACIVALKYFPAVNAEISGDEIVYKNYYNISFAVGTEKGLVVPVLKNADELSFADIEKNIKTISEKARDGKLNIEDLQGGTFTISNGGVYGSMLSTPILNLPQSGVLGMHNIVERPTVVDGEIKIRPIMYLALSYDHRIIDGKDSVSFLKTVKENLENPGKLFLEI
tara:strand:- start:345 stop:1643 length:1299 start_codon:yes stop_codon:yes gene_type:complete